MIYKLSDCNVGSCHPVCPPVLGLHQTLPPGRRKCWIQWIQTSLLQFHAFQPRLPYWLLIWDNYKVWHCFEWLCRCLTNCQLQPRIDIINWMVYILHYYICIYTWSIARNYFRPKYYHREIPSNECISLALSNKTQMKYSSWSWPTCFFHFFLHNFILYKILNESFINLRLVQKLDLNYDLPFTFHDKMWRSCICSISSLCDDIYIECITASTKFTFMEKVSCWYFAYFALRS